MSYAERRRRKTVKAKPGKLDRSSSWSVHAFGACLPDCLYCMTERAIESGNVEVVTLP